MKQDAPEKNQLDKNMKTKKNEAANVQPPAGETELRASCAQLLEAYKAQQAVQEQPCGPERLRHFQSIARRAGQMAQELGAEYEIRQKKGGLGVVCLKAGQLYIDEASSPAARQTMAELLRTADPVWIETEEGVCKMTFVFKLWEEKEAR